MFKQKIATYQHKLTAFLVDDFTKRPFFRILPDKYIHMLDYLFTYYRFPDLQSPKRFSEKIQWIKLYGNLKQFSEYADKYEVRKYIRRTLGQKYLIPLLGVWDSFDDINFKKLPTKFVLKATHGSGYIFLCKDKNKLDKNELRKIVNGWLKENFYKKMREIQYAPIKPRIIAEKYMEDETGGLMDYKFLCFNGKVYAIDVHLDRYTNHRTVYMNPMWRKMQIQVVFEPRTNEVPVKPKNLKDMIKVAKKLSKKFPFVRVDLYSINGRTYFGELTFTPASGFLPLKPESVDYKMGKLIDLNGYLRKK